MILLTPIFNLTQAGDTTSDISSAVFYISSVFVANYQQYLIARVKCRSGVAATALWLLAKALSSRAPSSTRAKYEVALAMSQCQGPMQVSCQQGRCCLTGLHKG